MILYLIVAVLGISKTGARTIVGTRNRKILCKYIDYDIEVPTYTHRSLSK